MVGASASRIRSKLVLSLIFLAAFQTTLASAASQGPPYEKSGIPFTHTIQDETGMGRATATASNDAFTGSLAVTDEATSNAPIGVLMTEVPFAWGYVSGHWDYFVSPWAGNRKGGLGVGSAYARSYGRFLQSFYDIAPGTHTVKVTFSNVTATVDTSPLGYLYGTGNYGNANVAATVNLAFFPCPPPPPAPTTCRGSFPAGYKHLADSITRTWVGGDLVITVPFEASGAGYLQVYPGLSAAAAAVGKGHAYGKGSATVTNIQVD